MPFTLGQRWISDTESELGLGTVVAVDARTVTLLFPSTGENRLYARSDSPRDPRDVQPLVILLPAMTAGRCKSKK